jgi:hypothetical protein
MYLEPSQPVKGASKRRSYQNPQKQEKANEWKYNCISVAETIGLVGLMRMVEEIKCSELIQPSTLTQVPHMWILVRWKEGHTHRKIGTSLAASHKRLKHARQMDELSETINPTDPYSRLEAPYQHLPVTSSRPNSTWQSAMPGNLNHVSEANAENSTEGAEGLSSAKYNYSHEQPSQISFTPSAGLFVVCSSLLISVHMSLAFSPRFPMFPRLGKGLTMDDISQET